MRLRKGLKLKRASPTERDIYVRMNVFPRCSMESVLSIFKMVSSLQTREYDQNSTFSLCTFKCLYLINQYWKFM